MSSTILWDFKTRNKIMIHIYLCNETKSAPAKPLYNRLREISIKIFVTLTNHQPLRNFTDCQFNWQVDNCNKFYKVNYFITFWILLGIILWFFFYYYGAIEFFYSILQKLSCLLYFYVYKSLSCIYINTHLISNIMAIFKCFNWSMLTLQ